MRPRILRPPKRLLLLLLLHLLFRQHVPVCASGWKELDREDITILMGSDALVKGGITERISGDHVHRLWMENWTSLEDSFTWHLHVTTETAGDYRVRLVAASHFKMAAAYDGGSSPVPVELAVVAQSSGQQCERDGCREDIDVALEHVVSRVEHSIPFRDSQVMMQFDRFSVEGSLNLPVGSWVLVLRAIAAPDEGNMNLQLLSVELARDDTLAAVAAEKDELRADTAYRE